MEGSMCLVDEEGDLLELEVKEPIALVHGVTAEVVSEYDMPVGAVRSVQESLQVFGYLQTVLVQGQLQITLLLLYLSNHRLQDVVGAVHRPQHLRTENGAEVWLVCFGLFGHLMQLNLNQLSSIDLSN
jgi:hypothetical protein